MAKEHHFAAHLAWTGATAGPTRTYQGYDRAWRAEVAGKPPLEGSADPVFRGDPASYNPEDLLVVALSACHMLTYLALCARAGIEVTAYDDQASGTMAIRDGRMRFVEVTLEPRVVIAAGDPEQAQTLHAQAHADCFIANSVNFPVRNRATVSGAGT
jgi:organic hydroperoxide reductase OsmC/OhrA